MFLSLQTLQQRSNYRNTRKFKHTIYIRKTETILCKISVQSPELCQSRRSQEPKLGFLWLAVDASCKASTDVKINNISCCFFVNKSVNVQIKFLVAAVQTMSFWSKNCYIPMELIIPYLTEQSIYKFGSSPKILLVPI